MTGVPFVIVFILAIVVMIVMISKFKIHPFLSILLVSTILGIIGENYFFNKSMPFITDNADVLQSIGIFFPFLLAAILKSAQGSSTVASTTTAGIMAH